MILVYLLCSFLFLAWMTIFITSKIVNLKKEKLTVTEFSSYIGIMNYHLEIAYEIVYRKDILVYALDASMPPESDYSAAAKKFAQLSLKLLGKKLTKELIYLYGDYETLCSEMTIYFYSKLEADEIRKTAVEDLMSGETEKFPVESLSYKEGK